MDAREAIELGKKHEAVMVDLKFIDLIGKWQHTSVPFHRLTGDAFEEGFGFDGSSIRVPTADVSVVDLKIVPSRDVTIEEINDAMRIASEGPLRGVLAVETAPLVSIDFLHVAASAILATTQTQVIEGKLARVLAWYDNEWGFSTRMADTALAMGKLL